MNKMERNDLRIERIINERKNLLDLVKTNIIKDQNEYLRDDIANMVCVLVKDEEHVKSYEAVVKAQSLIESLTKQIVETTTVEEIIVIRNKLNYYINKIKKEVASRGISDEDCNKYYEHATILRKDIAKYIRFLKKEKRIEELKETNSNYDTLSDEDKKKLAHDISNERSYNTRIMKMPIESTFTPKKEEEPKLEENQKLEEEEIKLEDSQELEEVEDEVSIDNHEEKTSLFSEVKKVPRRGQTYKDDIDYVSSKINDFSGKYHIVTPHPYNKSVPVNMINYLRNIRIYAINKANIRKMIWDFQNYYRGDDFYSFIEYNRTNNSFREGLRSVFKKSSLYNNENLHLNNHQRCVEWILEFIKNKGIRFNYEQTEKAI